MDRDRYMGISRGTAFVRFDSVDPAAAAVLAAAGSGKLLLYSYRYR